ncbi:MAG: secondary thiamine-phosphate synthase enzyme YjbQ [Candidatus Thermoplasmatota archaeon]|nr:secondary thiamine-phosphate synthase enzyme YjbQ [Candidatus Thermoplasmatota archaeon]
MAVKTFDIALPRTKEGDILDITRQVQDKVSDSGIKEGMALVFVSGSTAAITTIEYEPGLVEDMNTAMERLAPRGARYGHEERWHDGNGHSHIRAALLGPGITIPIGGGQLTLGTWQQIAFMELDNKTRTRHITLKIMGE